MPARLERLRTLVLAVFCCAVRIGNAAAQAAILDHPVARGPRSVENATALDAPLSPWSALKAVDDSLIVTEKSIRLLPNGLPRQINLGKDALLLAPLSLTIGGRVLTERDTTRPAKWQISATGDRAAYDAEMEAVIDGKPIRISIKGEVWFDGLIKIELSIPRWPFAPGDEAIRYRIPLNKDLGRFMHRWGPVGKRNLALDESGDGLSFPYLPYLWLGNDFRGLYWLAESPAEWRNAADSDALRVERKGSEVALEVKIVPQAQRDGGWRHRFALLPTPVKSLPPGWRSLRMMPAARASAYVMWPNKKEIDAPYFGYPASLRPVDMARDIANYKRGGVTVTPYACPTWFATKAPEWAQHRGDWLGGAYDHSPGDSRTEGVFINVCPARESWKEFVKTRFGEFIEQFALTGLYMDNAQVYEMYGCLDRDNVRDHLEYPMLDQRDVYRSVVEGLRKNSDKTFAIVHSSGGVNLPSFDFVDGWVSGEQYQGLVKGDYLDVASLTDFRIELNGAHWGIVPLFLPEFPAEEAKAVGPTRKLMSILMLLDVTPWPQWANVDEINRDLSMLDEFDVSAAEFIPYYSAQPLAKAAAPGVYVSGYRKKGTYLLIVSNLTKSSISTELCANHEAMGSAIVLESWPARESIETADGCAPISIPAGSFAMYHAAPPAASAVR
jgi:hypothetical protein